MRFSDLIGNDALKASLVKMVESGRTPHALLFVEQEGMGAAGFAVALSQYLNCKNHVPSDFGGDSCGECPACRSRKKYDRLKRWTPPKERPLKQTSTN